MSTSTGEPITTYRVCVDMEKFSPKHKKYGILNFEIKYVKIMQLCCGNYKIVSIFRRLQEKSKETYS